MYIYLLIILAIILAAVVLTRKEGVTQLIETSNPTVVGGLTASKYIFNHKNKHSTNVLKLLGNTNQNVILIHNTPFNLEAWNPLYIYTQSLVNDGARFPNLYCYDMLGHGVAWQPVDIRYNDDDINNRAWSGSEFVQDLYELYHHFIKDGKITVVGYGTGGKVAQAFTIKYPHLVDHAYILASNIRSTITGIQNELPYLVNWVRSNPDVSYLTMEESFVQSNLCLWYNISNLLVCPDPRNASDTKNEYRSVPYLLGQKMYRTASCSTYIQMDKVATSMDLRKEWNALDNNPPVTYVIASNDNYTNLDELREDTRSINNAQIYVIRGKHAFPLIEYEFLFNLITGKDVSGDPLVINIYKN